jgi:hypothetical protein
MSSASQERAETHIMTACFRFEKQLTIFRICPDLWEVPGGHWEWLT